MSVITGRPVTRLGDICSGHGCFPPRTSISGSPNVFVNSLPAHRQSDAWGPHCCPNKGCHTSVLLSGSMTVFANGLPLGRIGDPVACGSISAQGSRNVFAGG